MKIFSKENGGFRRVPLLILYTLLSPFYFSHFFVEPPINPYSPDLILYKGLKDIILLAIIIALSLRYILEGKLISRDAAPIISFSLYALAFAGIVLILGEAGIIDLIASQDVLLFSLAFPFFIGELRHANLKIDTIVAWIIKVCIVVAILGIIESLFLGVQQIYFQDYRAASTMFHPNIFGWTMGFCSVLSYVEYMFKSQRNGWIILVILFLIAAVVSGSRSAVILSLSTMILLTVVGWRRFVKKTILFLFMLMIIITISSFLIHESPNIERSVSRQLELSVENGFEFPSAQIRVDNFKTALSYLGSWDALLLGKYSYNSEAQKDINNLVSDNFYLQLWANYGFFGLIFFLGSLGIVLLRWHIRSRHLPMQHHRYSYLLGLFIANNCYFLFLGGISSSIGNFPIGLFYWLINAGLVVEITHLGGKTNFLRFSQRALAKDQDH